MGSLTLGLCLLLIIHAVVSKTLRTEGSIADPVRCCITSSYEGNMTITQGEEAFHMPSIVIADASFSVDIKNKRLAVMETVYVKSRSSKKVKKVQVNILAISADNTTYVIRPAVKRCMRLPMEPFNSCIPKNATYLGAKTLGGLGGASIVTDVWGASIDERKTKGFAKVYVTKDKCAPVFQVSAAKYRRVKMLVTETFSDLKVGIKDPKVFTVPDYCHKKLNELPDSISNEVLSRHRARFTVW